MGDGPSRSTKKVFYEGIGRAVNHFKELYWQSLLPHTATQKEEPSIMADVQRYYDEQECRLLTRRFQIECWNCYPPVDRQ